MKYLQQHKFLIASGVAAVLAFFCLKFFVQGMKKDYSMDLYKKEVQLKEQERKAIIEARKPLEQVIKEQSLQLIEHRIKDSLLSTKINATENRISEIKKPEYVKKKVEAVNSLDANSMLNYLKQLPEPNDY